jgi:putative lipoprotein
MKNAFASGLLALSALWFLTGCSHLDLAGPSTADRVLTGVVTARVPEDLPANAELIVRVVDLTKGEARAEVLGEQTIKNPGSMPVAFRIEYRAEDAQLRTTVDVDARISVGHRLLFMTTSRHPVTLGNVNDAHTIEVEPVAAR